MKIKTKENIDEVCKAVKYLKKYQAMKGKQTYIKVAGKQQCNRQDKWSASLTLG